MCELRTKNGELADAVAIPDEVGINLQDLQDFARLRAGEQNERRTENGEQRAENCERRTEN